MTTHTKVLSQLLSTTWAKDYERSVVQEAYEVMTKFAPVLAAVPALAGHWVKAMLAQSHITVGDIEELCNAELAARETCDNSALHDLRYMAFIAGTHAMMPHIKDDHEGIDITAAFDTWIAQQEGER